MKQTSPWRGTFSTGVALAGVLLFSSLQVPGALADSSVWEVSRGDARLYLGGTIHALRPSDYPLPEEFEFAFAEAEEVFYETDLSMALDPAFQNTIMTLGSYNDGRSLRTVLSADTYIEFYTFAGKFGIPAGALDAFKPALATTTVMMLELGTFDFGPQGVELHFLERASRDGLPQGELETVEFQARMLAELGEGNEEAMVVDFLEQMDTAEDDMNEAVSAWRAGDTEKIEELLMRDMAQQFPEDFELIFTRRNRNWLPQIMAMLDDADTELVLVGVGHMPGESGLLELLRREGATVRPLNL